MHGCGGGGRAKENNRKERTPFPSSYSVDALSARNTRPEVTSVHIIGVYRRGGRSGKWGEIAEKERECVCVRESKRERGGVWRVVFRWEDQKRTQERCMRLRVCVYVFWSALRYEIDR